MNSQLCVSYTRAYSPRMSIGDRLDKAMAAAGFPSQSALARASGVPQPTINRILKGVGKKGPEAHTVAELAKACNVSFTWLFEGLGQMGRIETPADNGDTPGTVSVKDDDSSEFVRVQLVKNFLHAGLDGIDGDFEPDDEVQVTIPRSWLEAKGISPNTVKAIKLKGLSMYPTLKPGTIAIVNLADRIPVDGKIFAVNVGDKSVIKRLEWDHGMWYLASDNPAPEFRRRAVVDNEVQIVGRVGWAIADLL